MTGSKMDWDSSEVESPKESMHSELLMRLGRHDIQIPDRISNPRFEIAAWLKLKKTEHLPKKCLA